MNEGKCVKSCPESTYKLNEYSCAKCPEICETCEDSKTCLTCKEGLNFYNGECLDVCVNGTYPFAGQCESCGDNCQTCISEIKREACLPRTYEYKGKCLKGSYLDLVELKCSDCKTGCCECISYEICNNCEKDYFLYDDKNCVKESPVGFRKNFETCSDNNCKFCNKDKNVCYKSNDGFSLRDDKTCGGCPPGQVSFKKICINCYDKENCVLCSSTNTKQCVTCAKNKVFYYLMLLVLINNILKIILK